MRWMNTVTNLSAQQIRAGRALLGVAPDSLAATAGVSIATLRRVEAGAASPDAVHRVATALEQAGVQFVPDGVQLQPALQDAARRSRRIDDILAQADRLPDVNPKFGDADLYDRDGLPA